MNPAITYTTTIMPAMAAVSSRAHSVNCESATPELGVFGTIIITLICFGAITAFLYIAFGEYRDKVSTIIGVFSSIIVFLVWVGIVFHLM